MSVPEGAKSGLAAGETGWISGLDKFVKRQGDGLLAWMQAARQHRVFNQVVTVSGEDAPAEVIGHLSLYERPSGGPQYFCHLEVFSQDERMKDFLANRAGVTTGAAVLHTLADKTRWYHREQDNTFVVAGVGGDPSLSTAERYTPENECRQQVSDGKTWYYIPGELAWMVAEDVERANQFDLEKRGFMPLEQEEAPQSIFHMPKESWLRQVYGQLEALARSETRDMYSSGYAEKYQKLLKQMDLNQDGVIDAGELWQAALDEQAKQYPGLALFNRDFINKLVWMKDVPEIRSGEALWHMHPVVFLDAVSINTTDRCKDLFSKISGVILQHEGGYVNDPDDKGGETNMGITIGTWNRFAMKDIGISASSKTLKSMTKEQAEVIYYNNFWFPKGFCKLEHTKIALMIYDWTVTSRWAIREVWTLLHNEYDAKLTVSNVMDDDMIHCINAIELQDAFLQRLAEVRKEYYRSLTITKGEQNNQIKYLKGWQARVDDCLSVSV